MYVFGFGVKYIKEIRVDWQVVVFLSIFFLYKEHYLEMKQNLEI